VFGMNETERLDQAFSALRAADAGRGAPEFLETRLRAAFREKHVPRPRLQWKWFGALATAALVIFIVWRLAAPVSIQAPPQVAIAPPQVSVPTPEPPEVQPAPAVKSPEVTASSGPEKKPAPVPRRPAVPNQTPIDAVTASATDREFIALPYAPPLAATDRGHVVRVRMQRQALRQLGLPMNEERMFERIPADVLLGEDGIPRAIRILNAR
jgi:hypothetical protein